MPREWCIQVGTRTGVDVADLEKHISYTQTAINMMEARAFNFDSVDGPILKLGRYREHLAALLLDQKDANSEAPRS